MSDDTFRWVIAIGVSLAALSFVIQGVAVVFAVMMARKTQVKVHALMDRAQPIVDTTKQIADSTKQVVDDLKPKIASVTTDATDMVSMARQQVAHVSALVDDVSSRAKDKVSQLDVAVDDTVENVQMAGEAVKAAVMRPVREVNGVLAGIKTGFSVLARGNKSSVNLATQDEEMFI
jgi:methyl-accepting chemotaxis protein